MTDQTELRLRPSVRGTDPATSHAAFRRVKPGTARGKLLAAHAAHPEGLTDPEAADLAGLSPLSEFATRCSELTDLGFLWRSGETRVDPRSGQARMVRLITPYGMAAAAEAE